LQRFLEEQHRAETAKNVRHETPSNLALVLVGEPSNATVPSSALGASARISETDIHHFWANPSTPLGPNTIFRPNGICAKHLLKNGISRFPEIPAAGWPLPAWRTFFSLELTYKAHQGQWRAFVSNVFFAGFASCFFQGNAARAAPRIASHGTSFSRW